MARYLVYTSPARGHLYPVVPTLEELRRRGHEVVVRTLASEVGLLRGLGFEVESIDPAIERKEHADWQARTPIGALQDNLNVFFERARYDGPDLRRAVEEERPDVLLVDINTWGAMAVAETSGMPWASWCAYFLPTPSRDAPPFGLGLPPARVGRSVVMTIVSLWLRPEVSPRVRKNKSRSPNLAPRHPFGGSSAHAGYSVRVSVARVTCMLACPARSCTYFGCVRE